MTAVEPAEGLRAIEQRFYPRWTRDVDEMVKDIKGISRIDADPWNLGNHVEVDRRNKGESGQGAWGAGGFEGWQLLGEE